MSAKALDPTEQQLLTGQVEVLLRKGIFTENELLADVSQALGHNVEVKLFIGAAEIPARVRLLGREVLKPGEEGWFQLELRHPVAAIRGDRYILRRPSPGETLGGGFVVEPHPKGRHKRFASDLLEQLESLAVGSPDEVLFQTVLALGAAPLRKVVTRSSLEGEQASQAIQELTSSGQLISGLNELRCWRDLGKARHGSSMCLCSRCLLGSTGDTLTPATNPPAGDRRLM